MRLNGQPPWDLIASALISVLALVLVHLSPPSMRGLSTILGFVLALPLFGYLLVLSLFPANSELSSRTRALLSLGASTFLITIISLVLIPRGLQLTYAATILSLLTLIMAAIAYVRWSALPRRRRFILWSTRGRRPRRTSASSLLVGAGDQYRFLAKPPRFKGKGCPQPRCEHLLGRICLYPLDCAAPQKQISRPVNEGPQVMEVSCQLTLGQH